jgi:RNA polymerase sigma factor (TIGR02999 family)
MTGDALGNTRNATRSDGPPAQDGGAAFFEAVYDELRRLAQSRIGHERPGHTLQATALVNEVYLRLFGGTPPSFASRAEFFAAAANSMRRILLQHARNRGRQKRGGSRRRVSLDVIDLAVEADPDEILTLDEAIEQLEAQDPNLARVVELRFFAGLTDEQVAEVLGVSDRTVRREWKLARAWLAHELRA